MILSQNLKKEQAQERISLKTAERSFQNAIVHGTNCSPFESQIIVDKAKEAFGLGEFHEPQTLLDGQMIFEAIAADEPPGKPIAQCRLVRCVITHLNRHEDLEVYKANGAAAKRRQQLLRISTEAQEQGALLTQEDIAIVLDCDVRTIRADILKLRQQNLTVPTRGTVRDIGPGVTHKRRAIELWLDGKEPLHVARALNHSLHAVERYIQTFCRVVYAQRRMRNILKTALVVGISVPATNLYWDMHQEFYDYPDYRQRLDEIMRVGESHWIAADGKKNPSPTKRPKPEGSQP